ncbi:extracellular solute-binding protein [Sporosarcina sp. YIM B06819]|uniref:extracellular solute-binding protein n=1 Tax=Sporosarcina sp. YIM B06819 TaxID=3081769 RepID=UPI00298C6104|nr:extracellular solute-binding protein [Sporosarcina sp. YIM B06819]
MRRQLGGKVTNKLVLLSLVFVLIISSTLFTVPQKSTAAGLEENKSEKSPLEAEVELEPYLYEVKQQWASEGIPNGKQHVTFAASEFAAKSAESNITIGSYKGKNEALLWSTPGGWVEYELDMAQEGLYQIDVDYIPFSQEDGGSKQSVIFGAEINGAYPYREARSIELRREFRDLDVHYDKSGNQIRSLVEELTDWKTTALRESGGANVEPLVFHLKQGTNKIRLFTLREAVAFKSFTVKPLLSFSDYENVKKDYPTKSTATDKVIKIEAENFAKKNSTSIQVQYDRDPLTTPESLKTIKFNTLGGMSWFEGKQAVTWEFEVPEDGEYKIAFRGLQNYRKNLSVFRTFYLDGDIPFEEMKQYQIPYATSWQEIVLGDGSDQPYSFYLKKGKHTLTSEVTYEPFVPLLIEIDKVSKEIGAIAKELRLASGNREDSFRVWDIKKELPGVTEKLEAMGKEFQQMAQQMIDINGETSNVSQAFESLGRDIEALLKKPNEIPNKQVTVGKLQERVESQRQELMNGPLQIDKYYVVPAGKDFPRMTANKIEKLKGIFNSLVYSFSGQNELAGQQEEELNVWMMWGRDYAEELQQLADQQFTPKHGIKVNVNLIQDKNLLILAKAAGIMPDVALGVPADMPFEMALRGAAKDISTLPGAQEVIDNYAPGVSLPFFYDGGYYGLPETINFKVLFYRKDILQQMGLGIPDTWQDVYDMMPTLLQNQSNFYVDPKDFSYMLYQKDVELYSEDGMSSRLDQANAFKAFEEWTNLFNLRGMDKKVQSFYQQFRKGGYPIGIADFNQYMQLLVAAPEILDVWGIAPIPGHINESGEVVRWAGGTGLGTTSMMLFNDTLEEKQNIAWEFMKWYASAETQTEFGLNLEQFRGETFRWNSANIDAFAQMPWRQADLDVILNQWQWLKDIANVPGGYMTLRQLDFAWNQTVIETGNPRIELEKAVKEINRELKRKQNEFNLLGKDGEPVHSLDLPVIKEPWEGAKRFEQ